MLAEKKNHHPKIILEYNTVIIELISHDKNEVTQIKNAISAYELEYSKLPFPPGNGGEGDLRLDTFQDNIISVLSGYNVDGLNPREKPFYQGKRAKDAKTRQKPKGGVFGTDEQLQLADPWGREYYIVIDSNYEVGLFYVTAQIAINPSPLKWIKEILYLPVLLAIGIGMSINNGKANPRSANRKRVSR